MTLTLWWSWKRCDEIALQKNWNATYLLYVMKDEFKPPFRKILCTHSLLIIEKKTIVESGFQKMGCITYKLFVMGKG